jgi:ubiquinone/menaquinone biosynthesis C-methylase UbiE
VIAEMARVCKPGGHLIIVDIVVPDVALAAEYNYYEWLCDQSHTRCLAPTEFQSLYRLFGVEVISARTREVEESVVEWMDFSLTEKKHREEILRTLAEELNGGASTGLSPFERDSVLYFKQQDIAVVGQKKAP